MRISYRWLPSYRWLITAAVGLLLPALAVAQPAPGSTPASTQHVAPVRAAGLPTYVPPMRGSPDARISGATRGGPLLDAPHLEVLAPDHIGLTLLEQPTFFWSTSKPIEGKVDLAISAVATDRVVYKTTVAGPTTPGIFAFSLAGTSAKLDPQAVYRWSVTTVVPGEDSPHTIAVSGLVKRVMPKEVKLASFSSDANAAAIAYARAGVWYDAVGALSEGLQQTPTDARLHRSRAALLTQVGLASVADFDRTASQ
jgi:hypothetical protein